MAKSAVESIRQGETLNVSFDGYALRVNKDYAIVDGCDCSAFMDLQQAEKAVEYLQAWVRIQKKKEN